MVDYKFLYNRGKNFQQQYTHYKVLFIQIFFIIIYVVVLVVAYRNYCSELKDRKNEILNEYYRLIVNYTSNELNNFLYELHVNQDSSDISIKSENSNILCCYKQQCVKSNAFKFISTLEQYIPSFVYYKIDINKQMLHRNIKIDNYELEKSYNINKYNQVSIFISIDYKYWNILKKQNMKSLYITLSSSTVFLLLLIFFSGFCTRNIKNFYFLYFKNYFDLELKNTKAEYQKELIDKENKLMKKIWNFEYAQEKDIELNRLFSHKANKIALELYGNTESTIIPFNGNKDSTCSVILYHNCCDPETIHIKNIIEIFSKIFANTEENISLIFNSNDKSIKFVSREALYQVLYSVISCIIFILKEQSDIVKYEIKTNISNKHGMLDMTFEYNGFQISNEEDIFRFSNNFLEKKANPFLLSINQIFSILRANNFSCNISYNNMNFIKIFQNIHNNESDILSGNIIKFPNLHE